jgi:repressor LexA
MNLTPKQLRILSLIRDWRVRHGYSPTMQELADEIGVSKVTRPGARGQHGALFVDR